MENADKIQSIIDLLCAQFSQDAPKEKLIATAQSLIAELQKNPVQNIERTNVSVVMPASVTIISSPEKIVETPEPKIKTEEKIEAFIAQPKEEIKIPKLAQETIPVVKEEKHFEIWNAFGIVSEAPTITHYKPTEEKIDLNEKFNSNKTDIAQSLQSTPIHDLTMAIGINDRYLFINELFRGDEFMFERSIITLNKFSNYEQAHSWLERELRLKLGWDMDNSVTQQFEQLIKRRFI